MIFKYMVFLNMTQKYCLKEKVNKLYYVTTGNICSLKPHLKEKPQEKIFVIHITNKVPDPQSSAIKHLPEFLESSKKKMA